MSHRYMPRTPSTHPQSEAAQTNAISRSLSSVCTKSTHCLAVNCTQALYRGNGANVARLVPDVGFKFAVHDQFKLMFSPPDGSPPGVQEKMAAGAATGAVLVAPTEPTPALRLL
eukprot:GHUV01043500.1.p1 GENE.GHUV01043500.1~~GHUV01043500.1.p1  ORF type:complete len:114 (+),score=24.02 GHUV01043500.1:452-793(+)